MNDTEQRAGRGWAVGLLAWLVAAAAAAAGAGVAAAQPVLPAGPPVTVALSQAPLVSSARVGVFPDGGFVVAWTVWLSQFTAGPTVIDARFFNRDGSPRTDVISLLRPFNQRIDDLKVTSDGGFWLLWDQLRSSRTSVLAQRYDRNGAAMTPPLLVHAPSTASRFGTSLGVGRDGGAVVGWIAELPPPVYSESAVVRFFAPDGTPRSPELNLTASSGDSLTFVNGIGVEPDGSAWIAGGGERPVNVQHVSADGRVEPLIDVCQDSPLCQEGKTPFDFGPVLAMRPDGLFMLAWEHVTYETDNFPASFSLILGRSFNGDGSPNGPVFQVNARPRSFEESPLLTALPDGRMVVLWSDVADNTILLNVFCRTFDADGTPAGREISIGKLPPESIAAGADGTVIAVFDYFVPPSSQGFAAQRLASR